MYILITYDVSTTDAAGRSRLRQVAKTCQDYGQRVQNSVFECLVDPAQKVVLIERLVSIIDETRDSLRIYHLGKDYKAHIESYGRKTSYEAEGELII